MNKSIGYLLERVARQLKALYEPPEARTMAEWLLQHALGVGRMGLLEMRPALASEELSAKADGYVQRLLTHEPLQYVLGEASFYGREFLVSPAVLIPRPETEELVQLLIQTYQPAAPVKILDIGTGSGCISLTLAAELPSAKIWALDVSADALVLAKENAANLGVTVSWLHQDILREIPALPPHSLDAVVSNPPYVLEEEKSLMRQNVLDFEPHLALFVPNQDPLLFYRRIAELAPGLLKIGGKLFFEINEKYALESAQMLQEKGFSQIKAMQDLFGRARMMEAVWQPDNF